MKLPDLSAAPLQDLLSLDGRVAVVTGGASGIGRATAARLAEAGAHVAVADLDPEAAAAVAEALREEGRAASAHALDVRDRAACKALAEELSGRHNRLDIWCNIAGVYTPEPATDITAESWDHTIGTNLTGTFNGALAAAYVMAQPNVAPDATPSTPLGIILNTSSSTTERVPAGGFAHYIASKGGIEALTRALAAEWGPQGIRVLCVSPTMTHTPGLHEIEPALEAAFGDDPYEAYAEQDPLGRIGVADDIARVFLLAASDLSTVMTGSILRADAGDATV